MNDSIQNLHKRIKKEVNVEIGRGNLIECRYPEILTENRHARTSRLHRNRKFDCSVRLNAAQPLIRTLQYIIFELLQYISNKTIYRESTKSFLQEKRNVRSEQVRQKNIRTK